MNAKLSVAVASAALLALGSGAALAQTRTAMTPARSADSGVRETQALNMLVAAGDGQFSNFKASGRDFTADVVRNGQAVRVEIDPDAGKITSLTVTAPVAPAQAPQARDSEYETAQQYQERHPDAMRRSQAGPY